MKRRDFLRTGAALPLSVMNGAALPLSVTNGFGSAAAPRPDAACILLMLVGGPSHLDTWDMKPGAPSNVRGPFRPIKTNVPGIEISELFPLMAKHADKYALIRSVYHDAPAVHDTGHQLMQTGRLFDGELEYPHIGSVVAQVTGNPHIVLPHPIGNTGGNMPHGQSAGFLGAEFEPVFRSLRGAEPDPRYGLNPFGQSCFAARRAVESGVRFVTVNMFDTVFDRVTWDCHGSKPFSSISDYRDTVAPMFDRAYSTLLDDLKQRGLLEKTLVVAMGEFGRSPKINPAGGRDHWPQCWTIHMAGGGIRGGQVYGSSDATGAEPRDHAVTPAMVVATIYRSMGIPLDTHLSTPEGKPIPVVEPGTAAIDALFG